jgi:hypothetical protein
MGDMLMLMDRRPHGSAFRSAIAMCAIAALGFALALCVAPVATAEVAVGPNAPIGFRLFPADNAWNTDVSGLPVQRDSAAYLAKMGLDAHVHPDFGTVWDGAPIGIPYVLVRGTQPKVPITFYYPDESDPGPYPIPPDAPVEGGPSSTGDRHILTVDVDHHLLYEVYDAHYNAALGRWEAGSGAIWNLDSNAVRPAGWTSADAAGLPILPGLVRYDEVAAGEITHALRFTVAQTQRAYVFPASHYASDKTDPRLPPMGLRVRLKSNYDISGFPTEVQTILAALKKYGMIVADNGSPFYISGAPDSRWNDEALHAISQVTGRNFEVVETTGTADLARPTPSVSAGGTAHLRARHTLVRAGSFSDSGRVSWSATVNYGDGSGTKHLALTSGKRFALRHKFTRTGTYRVTVKVRDDQGLTGSARFTVVVRR